MMPTDMENSKFAEDFGEEKSISPTFRQLQLEATAAAEGPVVSEKSSSSRQYMIVGFVLAVSAGLLWFMRGQGIGVELAEGKDVKIDYEVDEKAASNDVKRQREVMFNLELSEDPVQVPADEITKNPFAMAGLTGEDEEPVTEVANKGPEKPKGPTPEEIRQAELDRLAASLELNTVLKGRVSLARINGKTYRVGDSVESEFILLSIEDRSVSLGADGVTYIIELDSN
ncbi:MAG: hypothetical protein KDA31_01015 [Phycisphaerales bacterium]|nr:hypothetical protein [Phycisphaerales bacterium]MCB9837631.1 hypothetical protein [Phycisphaera sp.]